MAARLGFRPGATDTPLYAPARDVAHMGPRLIGRALDDMEHDYWGDWLRRLDVLGRDDEGMALVAEALGRFFNQVPREDVPDLMTAWRLSGLETTIANHPSAAAVTFALIGQRFLFAMFNGLRDVTLLEDPDYKNDVLAFMNRVELACAYLALPRWRKVLNRLLPASWRGRWTAAWWERRQHPRIDP